MIPVIPKVELNEAKYTYLLDQVVNGIPGVDPEHINWNYIRATFSNFDNTDKLADMFINMYRYNEICDKDLEVFRQCVMDVCNEYLDYYKEIKLNYDKEYDYATGNKRIVTRDDTAMASHNKEVNGNSETTNKEYDLPNKVVDSSSELGYLTGAETNKNDNIVSDTGSSSSEAHSGITTIYADEFLDLKRKYLNQIRSLYHEFCEKFSDCFLHIY